MDFRSLRYVLEVAEQRSFSRAAEKLIIAQPSLSQYIKNVEEQLGVKLFDRNANPIRLTPEGEIYVRSAYKILADWNELDMQLTDITNLNRGRIILGVSQLRSTFMISKPIAAFKKHYPNIDFYLVEGTMIELEELMMKGRADMFITTSPYDEVLYDTVHIKDEKLLLAIHPEHPLADIASEKSARGENVLPMFKDEPFLLLSKTQRLYHNAVKLCNNAGFNPKIVVQSETLGTLVSMLLDGLGCAFLPDTLIQNGNMLRVPKCIEICDAFASREVVFAYRKGYYLSKAAKKFIEITRELNA